MVEPAPSELLPSRTWLTRVQHVEDGRVVIADDVGRLMTAPLPGGLPLQAGSIVEVRDGEIVSVVSRRPFRPLDAADEEDVDLAPFMPPPPEFGFERFYGSQEVIERARELVELPIARKEELRSIRARPIRGVLFSGPPGTGKTLLASLIATGLLDAIREPEEAPVAAALTVGQGRLAYLNALAPEQVVSLGEQVRQLAHATDPLPDDVEEQRNLLEPVNALIEGAGMSVDRTRAAAARSAAVLRGEGAPVQTDTPPQEKASKPAKKLHVEIVAELLVAGELG